jgi:hypothetical protein
MPAALSMSRPVEPMQPRPSMLAALSEARPVELLVPLPSMPVAPLGVPAKLGAPLASMPAGLNFAERPIANSL